MAVAGELAQKREEVFRETFVKRLVQVEHAVDAFADPAYLKSLMLA